MNEQQTNKFFSLSSFAGLLAIYALKLSFDKQTAFDRSDFAKDAFVSSADYFQGFIVACFCVDIVSYNTKKNIVTVTNIDTLIYQGIEDAVRLKAQKREDWQNDILKVEKYFE
jgi:hypothetical protein